MRYDIYNTAHSNINLKVTLIYHI